MSGLKGRALQEVRRHTPLSLGAFTANQTVTALPLFQVPPGLGKVRILGFYVACSAIPSDPDGTMLLNALVNDISEGADDTVVASGDLEALVAAANRSYALTLASESDAEKQLTLEEGDTIRFTLVNNSAAITTNPNVSVQVVWMPLAQYETNLGPQLPESQYTAGSARAF